MGESKKGLSQRQYRISLVARNSYHMVGAPKFQDFKMMIRQNIINDFAVTVEYIEVAENIFGSDVSTLKVTTTTQSPKAVVGGFIEVPMELIENYLELILCMDFMLIYQQALLKTIYKDIQLSAE